MQNKLSAPLLLLVAAALLALTIGCPKQEPADGSPSEDTTAQAPDTGAAETPAENPAGQAGPHNPVFDPSLALADQYAGVKAKSTNTDEMKEVMAGAAAQLKASGIVERAIKVGDQAPPFTLPAGSAGAVALETALSHGPVVLVFFRGGW